MERGGREGGKGGERGEEGVPTLSVRRPKHCYPREFIITIFEEKKI
jgi:hypothetical protein